MYKKEELKRQVRVMMDENAEDLLSSAGDVDALGLDELIEGVLPDVLRELLLSSGSEQLGEGEALRGELSWESGHVGEGMCSLVLPEDFLRLLFFQMSDWRYGVSEAISADSEAYRQQRSRWGAGRGNPERPVVALVPQSIGLTLEAYSSRSGSGVYMKRGRYLRIPHWEGEWIDIPPLLVRDVVRGTAAGVLGVLDRKAVGGEE